VTPEPSSKVDPIAAEPVSEEPPTGEPAPIGAILAYEAVAQAAAIAVQDAATYLRQVGELSAAAVAVCTTKMMETQDPEPWIALIERANASVISASRVFAEVGENAARVLKAFSK
jgi:hypothetical protein